ncbi:MAG: phosphatidylglycerophosphatase A [Alphaproteobacteria bacterium]|nr:phosphatidylglycerophosphatase A [Alphaproteobacteria bacterium]
MSIYHHIATLGPSGKSKFAPGTVGSLVAVILAFNIMHLPVGWLVLWALTALSIWLGTVSANRYMADKGSTHDPKEIVVDELAGMWLTLVVWHLWIVVMTMSLEGAEETIELRGWDIKFLALGFVLFRFFDIVKPWPISWADRKVNGGWGVMLDDLIAGVFAGTLLYALYLFWPLITGDMPESGV